MAPAHTPGETRKVKFLGTKKHMKRGLAFFKEGEYHRAIEQFELVLLHDKSYVRAHNNLGYAYRTVGDYDKALEVWKQGLKIDKSYRRLRKNITVLENFLKSKGNHAEPPPIGIEDFEAEIEWLSEAAELIGTRRSRFFETYLIEDGAARYALKTLGKPLCANQEAHGEFERACASWLKQGQSRYVVQARSLERVAGRALLALEYAPEGSLRGLLEKRWAISSPGAIAPDGSGGWKTLSLSQILEFAIQMCTGLHSIHVKAKAAHGDIRPENMLLYRTPPGPVTPDGEEDGDRYFLKITNIGLWAAFQKKSVFCDSEGEVFPELAAEGLVKTSSGFMTASLSWCAPELLESIIAPGISTDVYAFGVVLYEMFTGLLPFSGSTVSDLMENIQAEPPEHPSFINARIPVAVGNIVMKCLEEKSEARFKDFFEIGRALIGYMSASASALSELAKLCKRFKKISKFQFRDEESGATMMIVGGTESSSEVGQIWEIVRQQAEKAGDSQLRERIAGIEESLSIPAHIIGEEYPTPSSIASASTVTSLEEYRDELNNIQGGGEKNINLAEMAAEEDPVLEATVETPAEPPVSPVGSTASSTTEVFGPEIASRYSSLLIVGDSNRARRMLADGLRLRAEALLLESPNGPALNEAFDEVAQSQGFLSWLEPIFEELSSVSDYPAPRDFLESGMEIDQNIIATVCGFVFMLGDKFSESLETFNMISDARYLPALNIYIWAMSKFQSPTMETIRLNSLKNGAGLLKESIVAGKNSSKRSTLIISSHPGAAVADSLFLRGLVLEQLGEYKHAVGHFRECKRLLQAEAELSHKVRPWADLVQGKCMYDLGMPSEGFMRWQRILNQELEPPTFSFLELGASKPKNLLAGHMLRCCEDAVSRFTENAMLRCVKGKLLNSLGRASDAFDCAARALEIGENFGPAYFIRMEASLLEHNYDDALKTLKICTLREPLEPLLMLRETEILCLLGEAEEALHELRRAIGHGLDLADLTASIKKGRLAPLERFGEFAQIMKDLESI